MAEWRKVKEIVGEALDLAPEDRAPFLERSCAGDETLRREVESLLISSENLSEFMEEEAVGKVAGMFDDEPKEKPAGSRFNHYEIIRQIGAGGMGEVYLARDTKLGRQVAVKILNQKFAAHESNLNRFIREAKAASALNHPNILVIHEIGESEGDVPYIVSEFIEGRTLRELIGASTLKLPEILEIAVQTTGALAAAHRAHIVHRDIKPENLIVRPDGYVKILDFGLAKLIEQLPARIGFEEATLKQNETAKGIILGTVNYMSPEQAKGEKIDERTDIFSLGAVIYEMIAGKAPFAGPTMSETFANLINSEPLPLSQIVSGVPQELERIVLKTLRKNKDERYLSTKDLLADLREFKENQSLGEKIERSGSLDKSENVTVALPQATGAINRQTGPIQGNLIEKIKQHKLPAVALAGILLIALVAAGYLTFFNKKTSPVSASQIKSVMVLPLKNIGGDAQDEYLSDGITDELTSRLTKLKNIRVVSPSSAMRYKKSTEDAAQIGREMNVEAIIEGTVRRQADKFRVSLSLVNAADGFELWSDSDFNGDINNLLDAQSRIAETMAGRLKGELTQQEKSSLAAETTTNPDAYELFLKGKQQYRSGQNQIARDLFNRAIQLDPNFADAYAWRGRAVYSQFKEGSGDRATLDAALADANRALQIDPNLISARRALINIYHSTGQYEEGLRQGKLALETDADDFDAIEGMARAYFRAGMVDKSIPLYERAVAADPMYSGTRVDLSRAYLYAGKYQKGVDVLSPVLNKSEDANLAGAYWMAMMNYLGLRQFDKAIGMGQSGTSRFQDNASLWLDYSDVLKAAGKSEESRQILLKIAQEEETKLTAFENVRTRIFLGTSYAYLGEREKALEQTSRAVALEPDDAWTLYTIGGIHAVLNNRREAADYLRRSITHGWLGVHYLNFDSSADANPFGTFSNLRDDAEFQQIHADLQKKVDDLAKQYQ